MSEVYVVNIFMLNWIDIIAHLFKIQCSNCYQQLLINLTETMQVIWKESVQTGPLISNYLPNATDSQIEKYQKQIGKVWEVFQLKSKDHNWTVVKNHRDIQQFIIDYNATFRARLKLDTFTTKGIKSVCQNIQVQIWEPFLQFFQWQDLEIKKVKCMKLLKKSGGRYKDYFCCKLPWQWSLRDFAIVKSGVLYYSQDKQPKEYLPFGPNFKIFMGKPDTGYQFGIRLQANHRKLMLYAETCMDFFQFIYFIRQTQKQVLTSSEHRYNSFSPVRKPNNLQFLIDGQEYFRAVAEGIQRAQTQIMICGWFISPQFQLVRPVSLNKDKRFDIMLKQAADRGVKIFVLVYNQRSFLANDSTYVKQALEELSPLVKVLQHPLGILPTFWSHHEKLVIIDQSQAFMGGMDIAFGRFDSRSHLINNNDPDDYPGMEFNNFRIADLTKVRQFWKDSVPRSKARLPWHDVGLHLVGESVLDLSHHFIQYWNYASFQTYYQDRYILILNKDQPKRRFLRRIKSFGKGIANKLKTIKSYAGELKKKIFKDESDSQFEDSVTSDQIKFNCSSTKNGKRNTPSGFKYVGSRSDSQSQSQSDKEDTQGICKNVGQLDQIFENMDKSIEKIQFINQTKLHKKDTLKEAEEVQCEYSCQILRSVASWSIGYEPNHCERSVHTAYLDLIRSAKRFIYIENQFFISMTTDSMHTIKNEIANELYKRIEIAVKNKQEFKVWIVLPLIPGFAGQLDDPNAVIPRVIMHWQYNTIKRSPNSLISRIQSLGVDPKKYINFYGLRTHGIVSGRPHTQIVYLHSKLMIVDDEKIIIGSANINERSMRGSRDSEVCILIEQGPQISVKCNDKDIMVNEGIHNLRLKLFHQHFGEDMDATDPSSQQIWNFAQFRSQSNTGIYRQMFRCYPDDYIKTLKELTALKGMQPDEQLYDKYKHNIIGFAVQFPLQFLKDENLLIGAALYPDSLSV